MPIGPQLALGAYLLFLLASGWRLWAVGWTLRIKMLAGLALVLPMPLLFIIPGLRRQDDWSGMLIQLGLTLLLCGLLCLVGGFSAARLRSRRRK
ncbi:hypothetical protein ASE85_19930 [Sphingobium sp. Leaf26]|uniref:hypothetical protein n=1 Tax=Sphingobium sp. Leaf26 TaxID=1735693 RepID=UPI000700DDF8|nr:hypothetical protein [Sphingobium sp. Leaf26]KQN06592.1 hypothetical protein ASE85_19930 [Sphingobium sp. Leaf26]